jgi:hypothetical protein
MVFNGRSCHLYSICQPRKEQGPIALSENRIGRNDHPIVPSLSVHVSVRKVRLPGPGRSFLQRQVMFKEGATTVPSVSE